MDNEEIPIRSFIFFVTLEIQRIEKLSSMKILFYGAGIIGSVYALKLFEIGCNVTLLARDARLQFLRAHGVMLNNISINEAISSKVPVTDKLNENDKYDLIIVTVRLEQLKEVVPFLKKNKYSPCILFMLNNPDDMDYLTNELSDKKILLGFPGIGGTCHQEYIEYVQIKQQVTTLGNIEGSVDDKIKELKIMFQKAGFKTAICRNMQAWLKTHAVFISCISAAIIKEDGRSVQLAKNKSGVREMVIAVREGFNALKSLGIPVIPVNIKTIFLVMPLWFSVRYWQKSLQGETGTLAIAPHVNAAKEEMQLVAEKVLQIMHSSPGKTPTLEKLLSEFTGLK